MANPKDIVNREYDRILKQLMPEDAETIKAKINIEREVISNGVNIWNNIASGVGKSIPLAVVLLALILATSFFSSLIHKDIAYMNRPEYIDVLTADYKKTIQDQRVRLNQCIPPLTKTDWSKMPNLDIERERFYDGTECIHYPNTNTIYCKLP